MKEIPRYGLGKGGLRKVIVKIGMTKESVDTTNGGCVLHTRVLDRTSQKKALFRYRYTITLKGTTYTLVSGKSLNQTWCNQNSLRLIAFSQSIASLEQLSTNTYELSFTILQQTPNLPPPFSCNTTHERVRTHLVPSENVSFPFSKSHDVLHALCWFVVVVCNCNCGFLFLFVKSTC